jgi:hypothetical protein
MFSFSTAILSEMESAGDVVVIEMSGTIKENNRLNSR